MEFVRFLYMRQVLSHVMQIHVTNFLSDSFACEPRSPHTRDQINSHVAIFPIKIPDI